MADIIRNIHVALGVTDSMSPALSRAQARLQAFGGAAGAAGTAIIGALTAMVANTMLAGHSLEQMMKRTGLSADALSSLGYAAKQTGSDQQSLATALRFAAKNAYANSDAFKALGVNVHDSDGHLKAADTLLLDVSGAMLHVSDDTEKAALAIKLFGRSGTAILPLLREGPEGIRRLQEEARKLGIVWSDAEVAKTEKYFEAVSGLKDVFGGLTRELSMGLIPTLTKLAIVARDAFAELNKFGKAHPTITTGVSGTAITVGAALLGLYAATKFVGLARNVGSWFGRGAAGEAGAGAAETAGELTAGLGLRGLLAGGAGLVSQGMLAGQGAAYAGSAVAEGMGTLTVTAAAVPAAMAVFPLVIAAAAAYITGKGIQKLIMDPQLKTIDEAATAWKGAADTVKRLSEAGYKLVEEKTPGGHVRGVLVGKGKDRGIDYLTGEQAAWLGTQRQGAAEQMGYSAAQYQALLAMPQVNKDALLAAQQQWQMAQNRIIRIDLVLQGDELRKIIRAESSQQFTRIFNKGHARSGSF